MKFCPLFSTFWCRIHLWFRLMGGSASKVDDVTALPSRHKMADMCYYGNVMTTTRWWLCVFYIFNSTVIDWTFFLIGRRLVCSSWWTCSAKMHSVLLTFESADAEWWYVTHVSYHLVCICWFIYSTVFSSFPSNMYLIILCGSRELRAFVNKVYREWLGV